MKNTNQYTTRFDMFKAQTALFLKMSLVVVVLGGLIYTFVGSNTSTYHSENTHTVEIKEVEVPKDALQLEIDAAIASSSEIIEAAANKAAQDKRDQMEADIALEVIAKYKSESLDTLEAEYKEKAVDY
jgi:flagellar basal body-associated protein FliL